MREAASLDLTLAIKKELVHAIQVTGTLGKSQLVI
jgi:hypothetical protein